MSAADVARAPHIFSGSPRTPRDGAERYMSHAECRALFERIVALGSGGGETMITVQSQWSAGVRWARNQITTSGDATTHSVNITRVIGGARGDAGATSFDDASLRLALASAERLVRFYPANPDAPPLPGKQQYVQPRLWGASAYELTAQARSAAAGAAVGPLVNEGLISSGDLQVGVRARAILTTSGMNAYAAATEVGYSVTVRSADGTASGWGGVASRDWSAIDVAAITSRARRKCVTSANAVAIEPGRYTLVMEPQAVHSLMTNLVTWMDREAAERGQSPFTLSPGQSKIGKKILDERITLSTDPVDPDMPYPPFDDQGYPYRAVKWVDGGVLRDLPYSRQYALSQLGTDAALPNPTAYRMSGGGTPVEEMIASTDRGLLATRFSNMYLVDEPSFQCTGVTRDGLWLIERGKITKAVKNMRFTESPLFAFNRVVQLGRPERVYRTNPVIVPPVKVRDFTFTSLSDAV